MKAVYKENIEKATTSNSNYRTVLYTGSFLQLVVMSLNPKERIDEEVHPSTDQFFRIEQGTAQFLVDGQSYNLVAEDVIIIPAGCKHSVLNTSDALILKLYTIYSPPNHPEKTIHATKLEADAAEIKHH